MDAATNQITDPEQRQSTVVSPEDIKNVQEFVKERITGVVGDVPAYSLGCLQTNVLGMLKHHSANEKARIDRVRRQYVRP